MAKDETPKTSETVSKPPPRSSAAARERDRIALQGEQSAESRAQALAVARETQDWTPYYHNLLRQAGRQAALEGAGSRDQLMINRFLGVPDTEDPDPGYVPDPEALALIAHTDELVAKAQQAAADAAEHPEDREAALAAREAALDAREAAIKASELDAREAAIVAREAALEATPTPVAEDLDVRSFRPRVSAPDLADVTWGSDTVDLGRWAGRKRMTAEERVAAEAEGMELFGIDPTANSAWSKVSDVAGTPQGPRHGRNPKLDDPAARIAAINDARARAAATSDPDEYADALADAVVYEDAPGAADEESEAVAYARRQAEAQAYVDQFMKENRGGGF